MANSAAYAASDISHANNRRAEARTRSSAGSGSDNVAKRSFNSSSVGRTTIHSDKPHPRA